MDFFELIKAALASLLIGFLSKELTEFLQRKKRGSGPKTESYAQRLRELSEGLVQSSAQVDGLLDELTHVAREREQAAVRLEGELALLEEKERTLTERVHALQSVDLKVAKHFSDLTLAGERKSAMRDYTLFGLGVVVSTVIAILLKFFNLA